MWWVSAVDQDTFTGGLVTVARQLGASTADLNAIGADAPDAPDRLWALLDRARHRWVLVLDNVDEPAVLGRMLRGTAADGVMSARIDAQSIADGTGWLRPTRRGLVVVTSRDSGPAVWGRHTSVVSIRPLGDEDAARALLDRAPAAGQDREARDLARRLGGLPLALRLVGSYLGSGAALLDSFHDYLLAMDDGDAIPLPLASMSAMDASETARSVVMRTWEISLDALDQRGVPQARSLLRLLSCYAPATPIPLDLLTPTGLAGLLATDANASTDEHRLERGLAQLRRFGLVDVRERGIVVHPLVADTNRSHLRHPDSPDKVDAALVRHTAVALVTDALNRLDYELAADWPRYLALAPHLHTLLDTIAHQVDDRGLDELTAAAAVVIRAYNAIGATSASERLSRLAVRAMGSLPEDHPIRLTVLHELAWPIASQGRTAEAEALYRRILPARRRVLGEEHPETLRTRHELAWVTAARGRYVEAEAAYREVLEIRRRVLGDEHPDTLMTHHELGWAIAQQGRAADAEPVLLEVLDARLRVLGEGHVRTIKTRHELAWVAAATGRWAKADAEYRDLLRRAVQILEAEHPDLLTFRNDFAWVLAARGERAAATIAYREVLEIRRKVLGVDHPDTVATRHALEQLREGLVVPARHLA